MTFADLLSEKHITLYRLSKSSNIPMTTIHDIVSGKTPLLRCSGFTLLNLSLVLKVSIESLLKLECEENYNRIPQFLSDSIREYRTAKRKKDPMILSYLENLDRSLDVALSEKFISKEVEKRIRVRYFSE